MSGVYYDSILVSLRDADKIVQIRNLTEGIKEDFDSDGTGMWSGTYHTVWVDGWMDRFFDAIEANSDWLETITPGDFARNLPDQPASQEKPVGE